MITLLANQIYIIIFSVAALFGSLQLFDSKVQQVTTTPTGTVTTQITPGITETPGNTLTEIPNATISPTTTLMPLPAITLIFPAVTSTPTATITPDAHTIKQTPASGLSEGDMNLPPRIKVLNIAVIIIWLLLAGFMIMLVRHFR